MWKIATDFLEIHLNSHKWVSMQTLIEMLQLFLSIFLSNSGWMTIIFFTWILYLLIENFKVSL